MWPASQAYRAPPDRFPYRGRLAKRGQFTDFHPLIRRLFLADGADWPRAWWDLHAGERSSTVRLPSEISSWPEVDRKALAEQWRSRIREFLDEQCGQIGGGRAKMTGRLDVALLPTLARRENVAELTAGYGFVIVDECHHVPAAAFSHVMSQIQAGSGWG